MVSTVTDVPCLDVHSTSDFVALMFYGQASEIPSLVLFWSLLALHVYGVISSPCSSQLAFEHMGMVMY